MRIETDRLLITDFTPDMAEAVHLNSLDEDTRRFVPDEVFETIDEARETLEFLVGQYASEEGPFVHPILLKTGENIVIIKARIDLYAFSNGCRQHRRQFENISQKLVCRVTNYYLCHRNQS